MPVIGQAAPQPELDVWVQGQEPTLDRLKGQVVLIEVIQVNCPGCFLHALPDVIRLHESYADKGLKVFAIATAFEHFEHNTLNNLERLLHDGELQGDPLNQLSKAGFLDGSRLPYRIPFSVAMDRITERKTTVDEKSINRFILSQVPDFFEERWSDERRQHIYQQAEQYLRSKTHDAHTFELYELQGTPSSILIDKNSNLQDVQFARTDSLEPVILRLLDE